MMSPVQPAKRERQPPTVEFDNLLDEIFPRLNALHGVNASRRFWTILLYRYLSKCLIVSRAERPARQIPTFIPNDDFVLGAKVGDEITLATKKFKDSSSATARVRLLDSSQNWAKRLRARFFEALTDSWTSSNTVLTGFHYPKVIENYVSQPLKWLSPDVDAVSEWNSSKRIELKEIAQEVDAPLVKLALDWLPKFYVEEFLDRHKRVKIVAPMQKEFHASFLSAANVRYIIASYVEEGSKLSIYQHAAEYGELKDHIFHNAESAISDRFLTWGWKLRSNDVPFLAHRLIKPISDQIRPKANASNWLYMIVRYPFPWTIDTTLRIQDILFRNLKTSLCKKVLIRPRIDKGGTGSMQIAECARSECQAIDAGKTPFTQLANNVELVIFDSFPSTGFMECLADGLPVIAIVPEETSFTSLAEKFYKEFYRIGLLHRDPESAANFLNAVSIKSWWQEVRNHPDVHEYLETFCRTKLPC